MRSRQWPWFLIVGLAFIWRAVYAYWTPLVNRYLVPPGDDPIYHLNRIDGLLHGQFELFHDGYPLGFHLLTAMIARVSGMDSLTAIRLVPPLLLIIPVLVIFFVGRRLFGSNAVGAIAAAAWSFLALAPIRSFGDGNYPNLLADSIFLPWAMLALYQFCTERTAVRLVGLLAPVGLIVLTHHLTFVHFIVAALPLVLFTLHGRLRDQSARRRTLRNLFIGVAVLLVAGIAAWPVYGPPLLLPYLAALVRHGSLESILGPFSASPTLGTFLEVHTPLFLLLGCVGVAALWLTHQSKELKVFLLGWTGMLVLLSITPVFGLPGRFLRELAEPLALLIGYFPVALWQQMRTGVGRTIFVILIAGLFVADWAYSFQRPYALPDPFGPLIRVQHDEEPALTTLEIVTPPNGTILANNSNPYLGYLVKRKVIVVDNPLDVTQITMLQPISTVYVGARPPLTPESSYPYFRNFDTTAAALEQIPGLILGQALESGTKIYRYPSS